MLWKMTVIWTRCFVALGSLSLLTDGPWCTETLQRDWSVNVWPAIKWQSHTEELFYRRTHFCLIALGAESSKYDIANEGPPNARAY